MNKDMQLKSLIEMSATDVRKCMKCGKCSGRCPAFKEMGADYVVNGGQTNNPSSEDFICAFDDVNADHIFVLPNNGNIVLTAKQAAEMYKDSDVRVLESKSVGEGYAALSMLDYSIGDADEIQSAMAENMKDAITGMLTVAVRTTQVNGVQIQKDDFIGFTNKTMLVADSDKMTTAYALTDKLLDGDKEFLIVVYGNGATEEQRQDFAKYMAEKHLAVEFYEVFGEQDVYDFIFIVE